MNENQKPDNIYNIGSVSVIGTCKVIIGLSEE